MGAVAVLAIAPAAAAIVPPAGDDTLLAGQLVTGQLVTVRLVQVWDRFDWRWPAVESPPHLAGDVTA